MKSLLAHRRALIAIGMWEHSADDELNIAWVRRLAEAVQPYASGGFYPNYEAEMNADRVVSAYGAAKYERLAAIKQKYDPRNIFRLNQNIRPAQ